VYISSKRQRVLMFLSAVKDRKECWFISTVKSVGFCFVGHTVKYFSWWIIVLDLTYYLQLKEDCLLEFSTLLDFSRVNSCACVRFYLSTSSTFVHHFEYSFVG
jgi:hypothetical protein